MKKISIFCVLLISFHGNGALCTDPRLSAFETGAAYYLAGDWQKAGQFYRRALALDSTDARSYNGLGMVQFRLHQYKLAEQSFRQAIANDSNLALAWQNLGMALYYQSSPGDSNIREAIDAWRKSLDRLDGDDIETRSVLHVNIGNALHLLGESSRAVVEFQNALSLVVSSEARFGLGQAYEALGDIPAARSEYEQIIADDTVYAAAYRALGNLCLVDKKMIEAIGFYQRAVDVDPDDCRSHRSLITALDAFVGELARLRDFEFMTAREIDRCRDPRIVGGQYKFETRAELDAAFHEYRMKRLKDIKQLYRSYSADFFTPGKVAGRLGNCRTNIRIDPKAGTHRQYALNLDALCFVVYDLRLAALNKAERHAPQCVLPAAQGAAPDSLLLYLFY